MYESGHISGGRLADTFVFVLHLQSASKCYDRTYPPVMQEEDLGLVSNHYYALHIT